mgnify:CR=1 FL=1|jgi:manganese/zinc/iron transport system substrate-binding protein
MRTPSLLIALLCLIASLQACGRSSPEATTRRGESPETLLLVATTGMVADAVRAVAGDRADVDALMGPGLDPHLYKPTRSDIAKLLQADGVFYNGLLLEGKMTDALIRAATSGRPVHAVTELIDESQLLEPEEFAGHFDPHVWMDPSVWISAVEVVRDKLIELDPDGEADYRANATAYIEELRSLDQYAQRVLRTVPESSRVLVTAHDAFNYFGRRYGFEVVGIQGISTESEAGVRDIQRLVDLLVDRRVGAVFVESTVSRRNIESLIAGARAGGQSVTIGGELFSDAMGREGTYEGTYLGMIDHNVTTIARALGGQAPERGRLGKLGDEAP